MIYSTLKFIDSFNNLSNMTQKAEKDANVAKAAISSLAGELNCSSIALGADLSELSMNI